jgi:hypothetical protein
LHDKHETLSPPLHVLQEESQIAQEPLKAFGLTIDTYYPSIQDEQSLAVF